MKDKLFKNNPELLQAEKILVAVSTGIDSMVLLDLLQNSGCLLGVAHVNHQLRPESATEARFLAAYCQERGIPFYQKKWLQPAKTNVEAQAREFRYAFFKEVMAEHAYPLLVTAHHGDDQAETILMRLVRGGSLHAHSGIARLQDFHAGKILRPLLPFSKQALIDYAQMRQLTFFEDATNGSPDYFRNRIRQQVVPLLKEENPQFLAHIQQFQQQLSWAEIVLKDSLKENLRKVVKQPDSWTFPTEILPEKLAARYYFWVFFFERIRPDSQLTVSERQLQKILQLQDQGASQWQLDLGLGWQLQYSYGDFSLAKKTASLSASFQLALGETLEISQNQRVSLQKTAQANASDATFSLPLSEAVKLPLTLRKVQAGDRIQLTAILKKRVNRYFIDNKIPREKRAAAWLVTDSTGEILAILPFVNSYLSNTLETDKILYILDFFNQAEN